MKYLYILLLLFSSTYAYSSYNTGAKHEGWVTKDGKPVPNTNNMKSINGFGGWLIITPDKNWEEKWDTPSYTTPHFSEASEVEYGENLTILTFYINPLVDASGNINITCGVKIVRPNNTISLNQQNIKCINTKLKGSPRNIRLSPVVIKYSGDKGDPAGEWLVEVNINDKNRGVSIPLKSRFTLIKSKANK